MNNKRYEYQLVRNGIVHYQGFKNEVANYLHCQRIEIEEAFKYEYELQGFIIKRVLSDRKFVKSFANIQVEPKNKENSEERKLKYLVRHLKEFGNTVYQGKRLKYYKEQLSELGIKVKSRRVKYAEDKREWYVLEVVNDNSERD